MTPKPDAGYNRSLNVREQKDFVSMAEVDGIDDEITLLRVKLKTILEQQPENFKLIVGTADGISRLVVARYNVTRPEKKGLTTAIKDVMKDIAIPIGIEILKKKL
jgi:hypothetical protein